MCATSVEPRSVRHAAARGCVTHTISMRGQRACCAADAATRAQQGAGHRLPIVTALSIFFTMGKRFLYNKQEFVRIKANICSYKANKL